MVPISTAALSMSVAFSIVYAALATKPPSWPRSIVKTGATALLAVFAASFGAPVLLIAALLLSALGDAFLSREGERAFLFGLASFLLAHVVFVVLFATAGTPAALAEPLRMTAAAGMIVVCVGFIVILLRHVDAKLRVPILLYAAAIVAMGLSALAGNPSPVIVGAVLFTASDMLLAWERFIAPPGGRSALARQAVWTLYYAAQLLITLGITHSFAAV